MSDVVKQSGDGGVKVERRGTERWLYRWMPVVDEAMLRSLEQETDTGYQFSDGFENRMRKLIAGEEKRGFWPAAVQLLSRAAALLLVFVGTFLAISFGVEAYRRELFAGVRSIWEDGVLRIDYSAEESRFEAWAPGAVPAGYRLKTEDLGADFYWLDCENEAGARICWNQMQVTEGMRFLLASDYERETGFSTERGTGTIYGYGNGRVRIYFEGDNYIILMTADNLREEEIPGLFEGMKRVHKESPAEGGTP